MGRIWLYCSIHNVRYPKGASCPRCDQEFAVIPICIEFDHNRQIGTASINKSALPSNPDWVLSLGYKELKIENDYVTEYELVQFGLINERQLPGYLNQER